MTLLYFGQIASITGVTQEEFPAVENLIELRKLLFTKHPKLKDTHFVFSVNKEIQSECNLNENDEIALLPPFSGG